MKYAIYKTDVGLRAVEYADSAKAIRNFPYIKEEYLPVIINRMGGYTGFDEEYEKKNGFVRIIEVEENKEPLTLEQMFPKIQRSSSGDGLIQREIRTPATSNHIVPAQPPYAENLVSMNIMEKENLKKRVG